MLYGPASWRAGTPQAIVTRLNQVIAQAMQSDEVKTTLDGMGVNIVGGSPAEFATFLSREIAQWRPIVKQSGARVN